jgi:hypothetical protein
MEQTDLSIPAMVGAIHGQSAVIRVECVSTDRPFIASARETKTLEVGDLTIQVPLAYLHDEFPSLRPYVYSTVSNSLGKFFVSFLPRDARIRDVLWAFEPHFLLRVWTVVDEPDFEFEKYIYEAERRFLDKVDDVACDFTIVYAFGKPISEIRPTGAISAK